MAVRSGRDGGRFERPPIEIIGVAPFGRPAPHLAVAVARAGGTGVLDLGADRAPALAALADVGRWWAGPFGVRVPAGCRIRPDELPGAAATVLVDAPVLGTGVAGFARGRRLLVEVVGPDEAAAAIAAAREITDDVGLVARGREAGGRVGELTTFVLLQHLLGDMDLLADRAVPVYAAGGIGPHSAAAAVAGGAAGVVLDVQLALVRETETPADIAARLAAMDGTETAVVDGHRVHQGPGAPEDGRPPLPVGQDAPLAAALAGRYKTAGGVVRAVREQIDLHLRAAVRSEPLAPRSEPAVVQGPMTQVSDTSAFAGAVAQDGGLPFLALALTDPGRVREMLRETADRLGGRPWGVGVLGIAPPELREAQLAAIREAAPPYAIVAGGGPAQAEPLEAAGISTYLHVRSPELLDRFLAEGARRFVFEGGECGGHVGPRASFPLWDAQVERLAAFGGDPRELSVMFAGGVHDARSAAMVAALAGPLAERGADVRVLMGTAYLFTAEAVAAGAILPGFQDVALGCAGTALLETAPGLATRCARTPYVRTFEETRRELEQVGTPRREVWRRLEKLNLGRLRVASKGLRRGAPVDADVQRADGLFMIGQVAALRSATTRIADLHEQVTSGATAFLAARAAELGAAGSAAAAGGARPADIAVVGMGCVFPGARDAGRYWANIIGGVDAVTEVTRWDAEIHYSPSGEGATPSKWGGFIPDVPFDALAHGIPPGALGGVDPVQLLSLEVASRALADAGYADRPFDRSRTSVVFGAAGGGDLGAAYAMRATLPSYYGEVPPGLDERLPRPAGGSLPGVLTNVIAGRIADRLDLGGAHHTVDAAGASSLAALDAACKELAAGTSDMVLCGGADLRAGVQDHLLLASAGALSPSGRCAAFDSSADGVALGEGVGCVVLKRLADAERDGDRIYAVVKSVAGAGDGRTPDLASPRSEGQRRALERAYERAGVSPASVGLVEAHGAGAEADDRTELATLASVFAGAAPGSVALGSVKSQIGHTRCAAGVAGLIKTAYALHTGVLPGTLHLARPNAEWTPDGPFAFGGGARPWAAEPGERYAGLSGFGVGGANFHAVLSGYDGAPEPVSGLDEWPAELFLVRGADRSAARAGIDRLSALLPGEPRLRDLARTAASFEGPVQVALVASDLDDLRGKLAQAAAFRPAPGVFPASGEPGQVAFLFPGQGSQRPGMLADLFVAFPRLQRLLRHAGGRYAGAMFPPAAFTRSESRRHRAEIADTRAAQPALGIAGLAVHRLLTAVGVHPDLAAGHGCGELVALCAAGVFDDADMIGLSAARAEAILSAAGADPGAMAAVGATPDRVRAALAEIGDVTVTHHDAPRHVMIAGTSAGVDRALGVLAEAGLRAERIPAACAFHSPLVAAASAGLRAELLGRDLRSPAFPVWSNATAAPYDTDPSELAATLAGQLAAPVRFVEQIEAMYAAGARTFVEAGPGRVLAGHVAAILGDRPHTAVSCDAPGGNALAGLLRALAELAAAGVPVDPLPLFAGRDARLLPGEPAPAPGWIVNGHRVRTADGGYPAGALRPAERIEGPGPGGSEAAVLEYLRASREVIAAQREVVLRHLAAPAPAGRDAAARSVPAPRPVLPGETLRSGEPPVERPAGDDPRDAHAAHAVIRARTGDRREDVPAEPPRPTVPEPAVPEPAVPEPAVPEPAVPRATAHVGAAELSGGRPAPRVARQVPRIVELDALPVPPESGAAFAGRRFLIVDDACGVALELADLLERHGAQVRVPPDVDGPCDGLVHLAALRPGAVRVLPEAFGGVRQALAGGLRWLVFASGAGGTFGRRFDGGAVGDPGPGAGLGGLARTIAREYPEALVRALDVDTKDTPRAIAQRILAELLTAEAPVVVGHEGGRRNALDLIPAGPPGGDAASVPDLGPDGVVLLTGGARGITARVALEFARTSGCHIELVGRTPEPVGEPEFPDADDEAGLRRALVAHGEEQPAEIEATVRRLLAEREIRRTLAALGGHAASVRYHAADVRKPGSVRAVVDDVYRRHRRLDGVVHGAGLAEDRLIRDTSPESFARAYRTKVDGAAALVQAVRPGLGFFVVFGGIAGLHGDRGQAGGAAAGDACGTLAHVWRRRLRGRVLVAEWGPWAGGGAVPSEQAREYARRGALPIDPDAGAAALLREIAHGDETRLVLTGAVR
ncbi:type I polyketide synthase [Actinomadura citrea]|uniref:Acyl transferase domain-containing protein/NAD(P)H-dependent flavin oxidoreductase YrpB (Nitropropane dioxygenase family)/NADP-dependent 3-hydroxy acid dehydrogenase YdfG n=1 Tax=Actinomadura citrea TaxID=46158 RepID=A0A7Y9GFY6_9ACTN|nr:type I polyketide synthase [Actinomadura citrea]NYE15780.1 acyl transferase domain-containing protein/NAD(P)H-dependent flavin oxidoreductase YrpB (nitropropane dioxygenase family)/NADP-dependent 3-hydroxy acid dehydrogenase YdfG [Actinomadura citrea]